MLSKAVGKDTKGKLSSVLYVLVAVMWLIPDRRIERALVAMEHDPTDP